MLYHILCDFTSLSCSSFPPRSIKRIIFNSLIKPTVNEKGEKEMDTITTSQALQISGRAGRFSTVFKEGEVTAMHRDDLALLKEILNKPVDLIVVRPLKFCFYENNVYLCDQCPPFVTLDHLNNSWAVKCVCVCCGLVIEHMLSLSSCK